MNLNGQAPRTELLFLSFSYYTSKIYFYLYELRTNKKEKNVANIREVRDDILLKNRIMEKINQISSMNRLIVFGCVIIRFCLLYKLIQGQMFRSLMAQKRQDPSPEYRISNDPPAMDGPPTPCPAKIEYATPVFARNYQGLWRYVVQIPYEGYFTQTVEVTKCT